jgi:hypothetical protein
MIDEIRLDLHSSSAISFMNLVILQFTLPTFAFFTMDTKITQNDLIQGV